MHIMLQSETDVLLAQDTLQYAAPIIVSLYYMGTLGASFCTLQKGTKYPSHGSRRTTFGAVCFVLVTYLFQTGLLVPDSFAPAPRVSSISANVSLLNILSEGFC